MKIICSCLYHHVFFWPLPYCIRPFVNDFVIIIFIVINHKSPCIRNLIAFQLYCQILLLGPVSTVNIFYNSRYTIITVFFRYWLSYHSSKKILYASEFIASWIYYLFPHESDQTDPDCLEQPVLYLQKIISITSEARS